MTPVEDYAAHTAAIAEGVARLDSLDSKWAAAAAAFDRQALLAEAAQLTGRSASEELRQLIKLKAQLDLIEAQALDGLTRLNTALHEPGSDD